MSLLRAMGFEDNRIRDAIEGEDYVEIHGPFSMDSNLFEQYVTNKLTVKKPK